MSAEYAPIFASIVVEAGVNDTIIYHDGTADRTGTIEAGTYFLLGNNSDDDIVAAVAIALKNAPSTSLDTWEAEAFFDIDPANPSAVVGLAAGGAFTLKTTGRFDLSLLGFTAQQSSSDDAVVSDASPSSVWVPTDVYNRFRPRYPNRAAQTRSRSGVVRTMRLSSQVEERILGLQNIDGRRVHADENSGDGAAAFSSFLDVIRDGRRVRLRAYQLASGQTTLNAATARSLGDYHLGPTLLEAFDPQRTVDGLSLWSWDVDLRKHVSTS